MKNQAALPHILARIGGATHYRCEMGDVVKKGKEQVRRGRGSGGNAYR